MPNIIAHIVFYSWPLVVFVIFRKQPLVPALMWSMVLGYLFLPARMGFDLPAIPTITKFELTSLSVAIMCWLKLRQEKQANRWNDTATTSTSEAKPVRKSRGRIILMLVYAMILMAPVLTVLTNSDPIFAGPLVLPGLRPYDTLSMLGFTLFFLLPFWLGRRYLSSPESHVVILKVLCIALLGYSLLALWEVRMSPQLNRTLYGFTASSFLQHMRAGGFRPLVFLDHGLSLGILLSMCVLAAGALWRHSRKTATNASVWLLSLGWLLFTLVLAKSVGALLISLALLPFVILTKTRGQLLVAAILAGVVILYPMLRGAGYVPTEEIHEIALSYSEDRAQSLKFRLDNEDRLLEKANEKPLFGWGSWGRNMVYDIYTGRNLSVTDGAWIIFIGTFGWFGYIARFGLITIPIILLALNRRRLDISIATAGLSIVLAANLVDLLPNSSLRPITLLIAGALMGRYIEASEASRRTEEPAVSIVPDVDPIPAAAPALKVRKRRKHPMDEVTATTGDISPLPANQPAKAKRRVRR